MSDRFKRVLISVLFTLGMVALVGLCGCASPHLDSHTHAHTRT